MWPPWFRCTAAASPTSKHWPYARDVAKKHHNVIAFGLGAEWQATNLRDNGTYTSFDVVHQGTTECTARIQPPGGINARNALGVFVMARALGLRTAQILPGLQSFRGVARRQELVGEFRNITVIDDFAHHPTAVAGVIAAVRSRYPRRRLWAVFEPRSNTSRRKVFQREYVDAFAAADQVIIGGVFHKATDSVAEAELFSPEQLAADLAARGRPGRAIADVEAIAGALCAEARPGDVILLMSNGSFGGLREQLARLLGGSDLA